MEENFTKSSKHPGGRKSDTQKAAELGITVEELKANRKLATKTKVTRKSKGVTPDTLEPEKTRIVPGEQSKEIPDGQIKDRVAQAQLCVDFAAKVIELKADPHQILDTLKAIFGI